ncbi:MAG: 23S rRNA (guanosine(2251)-2'-O)-methyltransferase RlmB [Deltaproteobacteria bacterium]|nr:23S rRNA (guanosine(2251)-2'-O)-methyltransferase RlmB [Deltaproteobacteria bacterium]
MQIIYGIHPVLETLKRTPREIEKIILTSGRKGKEIEEIVSRAERNRVPLEYRHRESLEAMTGSRVHQGVACVCKDFHYTDVDELLARCQNSCNDSVILLLDCIEDPQNLGSLIRTAHCFGVDGIIIPERRAAPVTPAVIKVSAGAARYIPIARISNLADVLDRMKEAGFWIFGTSAEGGRHLRGLEYGKKAALVLGGEGKGMRPLIQKKCDFLISIPMAGSIDSLNVAVAGGIIMHEIMSRTVKS